MALPFPAQYTQLNPRQTGHPTPTISNQTQPRTNSIQPSTPTHRQLSSPMPTKTGPPQPTATRYGSTYHTHTPSQWGTQALALNISIGIADHIKTHMSLHRTHRFHQRRIAKLATDKQQCPYSRPSVCFLLPGTTYHDTQIPEAAADLGMHPRSFACPEGT